MKKLSQAEEIWVLRPTEADLVAAARYAAISMPWTFNRMMKNTAAAGQCERALNIAKGIVAQEVLRRQLVQRGIAPQVQRKSHRDEDFFDFCIPVAGADVKLDVKSVNYYSNYPGTGRLPFAPQLLVENAGYSGPDWRRFFPMLMAHTQIGQDKEMYCFAIASSIDPRKDLFADRSNHKIAAFPVGEHLPFLSSKKLCQAREGAGKGFYLGCSYESNSLLEAEGATVQIIGEWAGSLCEREVPLSCGSEFETGPWSCVSAFQLQVKDLSYFTGNLHTRVLSNEFDGDVRNARMENVNQYPSEPLVLTLADFCNLILPDDYTLYFIGWTTKKDYLEACRKYHGWVWPKDSVNKYENQPWSPTGDDHKLFERIGFAECVTGGAVAFGALKTTGRGNGACCYVFPNTHGGGLRETNLYVLPQDLNIMDDLAI